MKKSADEAASWFVKERMRIISSASVGHVRFATNGGVKLCNSHPFISTREGCVIVHNGILRNFKAYKKDCKHIGLKFDSETDSEVLLKIVEREGPEKIYDVLERERIDGSANCIVLYAGGLMYVWSDGSLYYRKDDDKIVIASDNTVFGDSMEMIPHNTCFVIKNGEILKTLKVERGMKYQAIHASWADEDYYSETQGVQKKLDQMVFDSVNGVWYQSTV
jgi:glucosamine 6-phosphate synthetase-like amidotransferase/phosphosugar isomerase protein